MKSRPTESEDIMNTKEVLQSGGSVAQLGGLLRFATVLGAGSDPRRRPSQGTANAGDCLRETPNSETFEAAVESLFRLLNERRVTYMLVGGVALLRYVPARNTEDIDLLLAVDELQRVPEIVLHERQEWFAKGE